MARWVALLNAGADPRRAAAEASAAGRLVAGVQCPFVPPELIHALGLTPWRLTVPPDSSGQSAHLLQTFCCSWIQALLDQALEGNLAHLWGVVLACSPCDSMRNLPDIWRRSVNDPPPDRLYTIKLPALREGAAVHEFLTAEIDGLRRWLEQQSGHTLDPARLKVSTVLFNRIRAALRALQRLAAEQQIPTSLLQKAALGAQVLEPTESADLLEFLLEHAAGGQLKPPPSQLRLMLVAGLLDDPRLFTWLESHGAACVTVDACSLNLFYDGLADLDPADPLADMAARHLRRAPCATCAGSAGPRGQRLLASIEEHQVQGVIFLPLRGCDPHHFDNALITADLAQRGVPHLTLEVDPQWSSWGQLTNRLESFLELVRGFPEAE